MAALMNICRVRGTQLLAGVVGALLPTTLHAAPLIASDSFDYDADTTLGGASGGQGFTTSWAAATGSVNVKSPGLTLGSLSTGGNSVYLDPSTTTAAATTRDFATTGAEGTTTYVSFLAKQEVGNRFFGVSLFNGATERLLVGSSTGNDNFGLFVPAAQGGYTAFSTTPKLTESPSLLVLRIDSVAGNDTLRLYVLSAPGAEPATAAATISNYNIGTFDRVRIGAGSTSSGNAESRGYIDELRIGTTWNDVVPVPEPVSTGLLGGAALLLLKRRRSA